MFGSRRSDAQVSEVYGNLFSTRFLDKSKCTTCGKETTGIFGPEFHPLFHCRKCWFQYLGAIKDEHEWKDWVMWNPRKDGCVSQSAKDHELKCVLLALSRVGGSISFTSSLSSYDRLRVHAFCEQEPELKDRLRTKSYGKDNERFLRVTSENPECAIAQARAVLEEEDSHTGLQSGNGVSVLGKVGKAPTKTLASTESSWEEAWEEAKRCIHRAVPKESEGSSLFRLGEMQCELRAALEQLDKEADQRTSRTPPQASEGPGDGESGSFIEAETRNSCDQAGPSLAEVADHGESEAGKRLEAKESKHDHLQFAADDKGKETRESAGGRASMRKPPQAEDDKRQEQAPAKEEEFPALGAAVGGKDSKRATGARGGKKSK